MPSVIIQFDGNDYYHLPSDIDLNDDFDLELDVFLNTTVGSTECILGFVNDTLTRPILYVDATKNELDGEYSTTWQIVILTDQAYTFIDESILNGGPGGWYHIHLYRSGTIITLVVTDANDVLITINSTAIPTNDTFNNFDYRTMGGLLHPISGFMNPILNLGQIKNFEGDAQFGYAFTDAAMTDFAVAGEKIYTIENIISGNEFVQATAANQGILATGSENTLPVMIVELESNIDQTVDLTSNIDQTVELNSYIG